MDRVVTCSLRWKICSFGFHNVDVISVHTIDYQFNVCIDECPVGESQAE